MKAAYEQIGPNEILLKYFDIVAIAELGSGTFGKTGTNTATLFLRRKDTKPDLAEHYANRVETWFSGNFSLDAEFDDVRLLTAYCDKTGLPLCDYKTLLTGKPNAALLDIAMFKEYRKAFDASAEAKRIRGKRFTLKYSEDARAAELEKAWLAFLREIERDKLYTFMLAASNPLPVVLVKSPADKTAIKYFLGYEWSSRKGNEGIKYIGSASSAADDDEETLSRNKGVSHIKTPLFNPADLSAPQKINALIRAAFNRDILLVPDDLSTFVSHACLTDMLDFNRVTFDKAFKTIVPETREETARAFERAGERGLTVFRLSNDQEFDVSIGRRVVKSELEQDGKVPIYSANVLEPIGSFSNLLIKDFSVPSVLWGIDGDWMVNFIPANQPFYPTDHCGVIRVRTDQINPHYLAYVLSLEGERQRFSRTLRASTDRIRSLSLTFPAKNEQDHIVVECEAIDTDCADARTRIEGCRKHTELILLSVFGKYETRTLQSVCDSFEYGTSSKSSTTGDVAVVRMGNIQDGQIVWNDVVYTNDKDDIKKYVLKTNDVLFNRTNSPIWVGKTGLYTGDRPAIFAGYLIRVNYKVDVLNPKFLTYVLNSKPIRQHGYSVMSKAINQANISAGLLKNYQIPVPPLAKQNRIVSEIEGYEAEIAAARAVLAAATVRKRAILEKWL